MHFNRNLVLQKIDKTIENSGLTFIRKKANIFPPLVLESLDHWYLNLLTDFCIFVVDKTLSESNLADVTQYSNLSGGSLFSDEGLDLSFLSKEKLFSGPELDANSEEMVRG